jgi:hypothetical protein
MLKSRGNNSRDGLATGVFSYNCAGWHPALRAAGVADKLVLSDLVFVPDSCGATSSGAQAKASTNRSRSDNDRGQDASTPNGNEAFVNIAVRIGVREMESHEVSSYGSLHGSTPNDVRMTSVIIDQCVLDDALPNPSTPPPKPPKIQSPFSGKGGSGASSPTAMSPGGTGVGGLMPNLQDKVAKLLLPVVMTPNSGARLLKESTGVQEEHTQVREISCFACLRDVSRE